MFYFNILTEMMIKTMYFPNHLKVYTGLYISNYTTQDCLVKSI